jgi:Caspase domain/Bacterial pre-peptidase C-terminal domain
MIHAFRTPSRALPLAFVALAALSAPAAAQQAIRAGQTVSGALSTADPRMSDGSHYDDYVYRGRAGERVIITMRSSRFDTWLLLGEGTGDQFEQLDRDDDGAGGTDSRLEITLPSTGVFVIRANSVEGGATGAYTLAVASAGSGPVAGGDDLSSGGVIQPLGRNRPPVRPASDDRAPASGARRERGRLQAGDEELRSGELLDRYPVQVPAGQRLHVDLRSGDFDTYLIVKHPDGEQTENDDAQGETGHSVVDFTAGSGGRYEVIVTSYEEGETGAYDLAISIGGAAGVEAGAPARAASLPIGSQVRGRLDRDDPTLRQTGEYSDAYEVQGRPGETLVVELASTEFDPYLMVRTPDGESIDNDDHDGSRTRSRIELPMTAAGAYRVVATSYRRGETGTYTLAASTSGQRVATRPAPRPDQPAEPPRSRPTPSRPGGDGRVSSGLAPGTGRGGRVYGIFVGISDYGGRANDLAFTARDAGTMRDALARGAGLRPEDAIVLTDRQATVANVRAAMQRMSARVGPDDILVFFHSGHGGRVPVRGQDDDDPDGLDETISMYDADIRDDELGTMLDSVRAGMVMLVIDACYSGGFSKDVINRPGRVGFFSSEEDVVSAVAGKFRAGGYLPVFFSEAVGEGRADVEDTDLAPRQDGQVSLLELSQYLRARYGDEVKGGGGTGGEWGPSQEGVARRELGYQHLVVDRGGVDAYTVMFRW